MPANISIPRIIAIVGPTGSGKTMLAVALAHVLGGEIVSADSRQVYRGMDIGTAKPTAAEQRAVPHHLIDIRNPDEDYSVADYQRDAVAALRDIIACGRIPFLVGGTGLYIRSVVENLDIPNAAADPELRTEIERGISRDGLDAAFKKLVSLDPEAAFVVDPNNPRRVVRALEVAITTGAPFTTQRKKNDPLFNTLILGLNPPAEILRERIDGRVDAMRREGLMDEVARLVGRYGPAAPAFNAIGYREAIAALDGKLSLADAIATIKMNTWRYAKRQMTWFKKTPGVHWVKDADEAKAFIKESL
jgi:tRNA dimethylallyltransferase